MKLDVLTIHGCFQMWAHALEVNLHAQFDEGTGKDERKQIITNDWQKTSSNWWSIEALIETYHDELGLFRGRPLPAGVAHAAEATAAVMPECLIQGEASGSTLEDEPAGMVSRGKQMRASVQPIPSCLRGKLIVRSSGKHILLR